MKLISIATAARQQSEQERFIKISTLAGGISIGALILFGLSSCSDDKELPLPELTEKTYTGANTLRLTYDGYDMPGKSVTVTPGENGAATLTLFSEFDLSQLDLKGVSGTIPAPGVIPGDIRTVLTPQLTAGNGFRSFNGTADTGKVSFSYSGKIYADSLVMNVTDVRLADVTLDGMAWKLAPLTKKNNGLGYESLPFHIVWEAHPIEGIDIPLSEILRVAVTVPCIPVYHDTAYSSIAQLLSQLIQTVKWMPDGNIIVTYVSTVGGATRIATLNGTTLQYTVENPQYFKLYVNPLSVAGLALTSGVLTGGDLPLSDKQLESILPVVKQLVGKLAPQIAGGIPLAFSKTENALSVYVDQNLAVPVLQTILETILSDSSRLQIFMAELQKYPEIAAQIPEIMKVIQQLPAYIEQTTRFEFGFDFIPYK